MGPARHQWLLTALREGRTIGGLRFVPEPDAKIAERGAGRVLGVEQSNTSVSWGERSILKLFRRVLPGLNPDLEVHRALRSVDSNEVAALQGAVEGTFDGEPFTLAMLQDFAANSADGWSMALASVRDLLAEADLRADEVGGDFAGEASRLGETVAVVHDELRRALGRDLARRPRARRRLARAAGRHGGRGAGARAVRRRDPGHLRRRGRARRAGCRPSGCTATCTSGRPCAPRAAGC